MHLFHLALVLSSTQIVLLLPFSFFYVYFLFFYLIVVVVVFSNRWRKLSQQKRIEWKNGKTWIKKIENRLLYSENILEWYTEFHNRLHCGPIMAMIVRRFIGIKIDTITIKKKIYYRYYGDFYLFERKKRGFRRNEWNKTLKTEFIFGNSIEN